MQEKHRSATVLKELLLDLHHHLARLAWLIQKKKSGPKLTLTDLVLFIQIQSNSGPSDSFFTLMLFALSDM